MKVNAVKIRDKRKLVFNPYLYPIKVPLFTSGTDAEKTQHDKYKTLRRVKDQIRCVRLVLSSRAILQTPASIALMK